MAPTTSFSRVERAFFVLLNMDRNFLRLAVRSESLDPSDFSGGGAGTCTTKFHSVTAAIQLLHIVAA